MSSIEPSRFIWYELLTSDADAAARFYVAVVGWTVEGGETPGMDYRMWKAGDANVGGLMALAADAAARGMRPTWLAYLQVQNVDASVEAITGDGGALHMPAMDIPDVGRFALVADPQGAAFYVMTPSGPGESTVFSPGRPGHGGWHELHTSDNGAALGFYSRHLGWQKSGEMDMGPMGKYLLFGTGGDAIGAMMNNPNIRPAWLYYFNVEDIESARNRVEKAGGVVLAGPHEVPGELWMIQGRDPQGAMFALVGPRGA